MWYDRAMRKPSADELRKLKDKAAEAAAKGKLDKAAELYREAAEGDGRDFGTRQKLAEVLRRAGRIPEAIQAYGEVADRFGKDGLLIKAIAISKTILELDPQHVATQSALAELYAKKAAAEGARPPPRTLMLQAMKAAGVGVIIPPPPPSRREDGVVALPLAPPPVKVAQPPEALEIEIDTEPEPLPEPDAEPSTAFAQIVFAAESAVEAGVEEDVLILADPIDVEVIGDEPLSFGSPGAGEPVVDEVLPLEEAAPLEIVVEPEPEPLPAPAPPAPALPHVPIFSDLSREAFVELTRGMVLHRIAGGEAVIRECEEGTSFYVVASGRFAVSKRDEAGGTVILAKLGEGDFFGEMALLSGAARSATVTAEEEAEVLEFPADVLLQIAGQHPHVAQSLRRFYRQRLLANAMAASPVFRPFQRNERKLIMERFRARAVSEGEKVIREGDPSDGLYVVLEGAVDVVKRRDGKATVVGHLREGDLFGEMSCLRKAPASASIVVKRPGTLLRLPRKDFDDLVVSYPQILELVSTLSDERAENLDAILSGHAEWTDDGLVLT